MIHGQALLETLGKHGIVEETVIERFQNEPELFVLDEAEIWSKNGIEIDYGRRLADDFEIGSGEQLPTREDCLRAWLKICATVSEAARTICQRDQHLEAKILS